MANKADVLKSKAEALSNIGALFSDYLSDRSHQRQNLLLLTAIITILISFSIITPVEGTYLGTKFNLTNPATPRILGGIVSVYFLIIYIISAMRDLHYRNQLLQNVMFKNTNSFVEKIAESQKDPTASQEEKDDFSVHVLVTLHETTELFPIYNRYMILQLIFEIVFPILLAFYAIFVSLVYPFYVQNMR